MTQHQEQVPKLIHVVLRFLQESLLVRVTHSHRHPLPQLHLFVGGSRLLRIRRRGPCFLVQDLHRMCDRVVRLRKHDLQFPHWHHAGKVP